MPKATDISDEARRKLDEATQLQADILARELVATYVVGYRKAGATAPLTDLQRDAIAGYTKEQTGYLAEFNQAVGDAIEAKIKDDIGKGMTYNQIKQDIKPFIKEVFTTGTVEINRVGQQREVYKVGRDGNIYKTEKTIEKPYSTSVENYSDLLSHTAKHTVYEQGRAAGYQSEGITRWRFAGPLDERTRPEHAAVFGNIYEYGTFESDMAESLLEDVNCRHRAIAVINEEDLQPQEFYDKQKADAGLYWNEDTGAWAFAST